jgi:hypothetical protein
MSQRFGLVRRSNNVREHTQRWLTTASSITVGNVKCSGTGSSSSSAGDIHRVTHGNESSHYRKRSESD